jgi:hypothetical protein
MAEQIITTSFKEAQALQELYEAVGILLKVVLPEDGSKINLVRVVTQCPEGTEKSMSVTGRVFEILRQAYNNYDIVRQEFKAITIY